MFNLCRSFAQVSGSPCESIESNCRSPRLSHLWKSQGKFPPVLQCLILSVCHVFRLYLSLCVCVLRPKGLCLCVCVVVIGESYAMRYKKCPKSKPIKIQSGSSMNR